MIDRMCWNITPIESLGVNGKVPTGSMLYLWSLKWLKSSRRSVVVMGVCAWQECNLEGDAGNALPFLALTRSDAKRSIRLCFLLAYWTGIQILYVYSVGVVFYTDLSLALQKKLFPFFKNREPKNQHDYYVLNGDIPVVTYNNADHY